MILEVCVTSIDPLAEHCLSGFFWVVPIIHGTRVALDHQSADVARRDGIAYFIDDLRLVARHQAAAGARFVVIEAVRDKDMHELRRPNTIQDGQARLLLPAPENVS